MFSLCSAFLAVSLLNSLNDFHVSSCDENCTEYPVFTPSRLVVKYGDPTSAECLVCQHACQNKTFGFKKSDTIKDTIKTTILWKVDSLTEWDIDDIQCYNTDNDDNQCCSNLPITLYQPPTNVSLSFINHAEPMFAGHEYKLQCNVQEVAPVGNLIVTFYRGQTELHRLQSNNTEKKPVNETFTLGINPSKEDDGEQYWCEAKLDLGAEGPQPPPVVESGKLTAIVYYEPQLEMSSHPDPIIVTEGDSLQLDCSAVGNPSPSYNWTLPSATGSPFNDSVFTVKSVTLEHKGQYICSVYNDFGAVTVTFNVDVKYEPQLKVSSHPDPITLTEGDRLQLNCSAVGNPRPSYNWTLPSASGSPFNDSVFTVESVTLEHKGQYICSVYNDVGTVTVKFDVDVKYEPQLKVSSHPDPISVTEGDRLQLNCSAVGNPSPSYNWTLPSATGSPFNDSVFTVESVTLEHKGQYICSVYNDVGAVTVKFDVHVKYEPQLEVPSHPEPITVTKGDPLQLDCSAVGNPSPSYNWMLPSASGSPFNDSVFTVESVTLEHKGQYICSVHNDVGAVTVKFDVHVKYEPQLEVPSHPEPITVTKGDRLQLNCSAVGNPRPSYNWTLPSATGSSFNDSVFTIESVTLEHKGQYTCSVYNDIGNVTVNFNVDVKENYTVIILLVLLVAVLVAVVIIIVYVYKHKQRQRGEYDIVRFHLQPSRTVNGTENAGELDNLTD